MTHIDDLVKFKEWQGRKIFDKVRDTLLDTLVDFYFERSEEFERQGKVREAQMKEGLDNIKDEFKDIHDSFKEREQSYQWLLESLGKFFILYNHYTYSNYISWNSVMKEWVKWKREQESAKL